MWYWIATGVIVILLLISRFVVTSPAVVGFLPFWMFFTVVLAFVMFILNWIYSVKMWPEDSNE